MALPAAINPRRFKDLDIDLRNVWIQTFIVNPSPNDAGWALWHELLQYIIAGHVSPGFQHFRHHHADLLPYCDSLRHRWQSLPPAQVDPTSGDGRSAIMTELLCNDADIVAIAALHSAATRAWPGIQALPCQNYHRFYCPICFEVRIIVAV